MPASPGLGGVLIKAFATIMGILYFNQVEELLPVRLLFLKRRRAVTNFNPANGLVRTEPGFVHVTQIFTLCNGPLAQCAPVDSLKQCVFAVRFQASSD